MCSGVFQQADVSCVVYLCGLIHQRYAEFWEPLRKALIKLLENYNGKDEEKVRMRASPQHVFQQ